MTPLYSGPVLQACQLSQAAPCCTPQRWTQVLGSLIGRLQQMLLLHHEPVRQSIMYQR
jgi:hypothetical protein